ncbi:MAG: hypothetical protein IJZ94_01165 [Clostridia bacterium]|nr:hypothetical protein [Clostridia bacterium]
MPIFTVTAESVGDGFMVLSEIKSGLSLVTDQYSNEIDSISGQLESYGEYDFGLINPKNMMIDALNGEMNLSPGSIFSSIIKELIDGLTENIGLIAVILGICILSAIAVNFVGQNSAFYELNENTSGVVVSILLCSLFVSAVQFAIDAALGMESVSVAIIPLIAALGLKSGSSVFIIVAQYVSVSVCWFFIPMAVLYGALGLCECLTDKFPVSELRCGVKSLFVWGLGLTMTVFFCITAITGAVAGQFSGVAGKTVKYAGNLIPYVGSYLSESADLVFSGLCALKSAAGIGAAAAVFITGISPFLKLFAYVALLRIISFVVSPFGNNHVKKVINSVSESVTMLMGMTGLIGVFFIINIAMFTSVKFS